MEKIYFLHLRGQNVGGEKETPAVSLRSYSVGGSGASHTSLLGCDGILQTTYAFHLGSSTAAEVRSRFGNLPPGLSSSWTKTRRQSWRESMHETRFAGDKALKAVIRYNEVQL